MARKVATRKKHDGGMDVPRNSFELPIETSHGLYNARDNILYAHHMSKDSFGMDYYSTEVPIKKLISEEVFDRPNIKLNSPSVVARLMGVDMLPFSSKTGRQPKKGSAGHVVPSENYSEQFEIGFISHSKDQYLDQYTSGTKPNNYKPREHPQEEELQKFKKEFEAWQAVRFNESSNMAKVCSPPLQLIAQEDLNREKMYFYANNNRTSQSPGIWEHSDLSCVVDSDEMLTSGSFNSQLVNPSNIVILRPGPDSMNINEGLWRNSPSTSEGRGSMDDFLKEVRERLKSELQGNCSKRSTTVRGGGIETPYREKPSKPREIAQSIAKEVRDNVSQDFGMNFLRSESKRSYRSEIRNATDSAVFTDRDTRILLADRLKNVLRGEIHRGVPRSVQNSSKLSLSDYEKRHQQSRDTWIDSKMTYADSSTNDLEKYSRSFRGEHDEKMVPQMDISPMNLIRSLSAPVSGKSFGKLLLEDPHVLTGAQIRRKHEVIQKVSMNIKKQKKDKFNIREKVSSFRYNLTLRGWLFRRKLKSAEGSDQNKYSLLKDIASGPIGMNLCETNENSTEVPPSPASVSSSVYDELWRPTDYLSPISSSGGQQLEDFEMSNVFREINSNLTELRKKLDQFDGANPEETINEHQITEIEVDIEDQCEAYIRDLLMASGLYDGSFSHSMSKWDPLGKPISTQVFDEVEESYKECTKDKDQVEIVNHKMILDLLNEVLPAMLRKPVNISRYMEKAEGLVHKPPNGRTLLSLVWDNIRVYLHPSPDREFYSLDHMLARDFKSTPWSGMIEDDVVALCREIECQITRDVIEEMVEILKFT